MAEMKPETALTALTALASAATTALALTGHLVAAGVAFGLTLGLAGLAHWYGCAEELP